MKVRLRNETKTNFTISIQIISIPYTHVHRECEKIEKSICPKLSYKKLKIEIVKILYTRKYIKKLEFSVEKEGGVEELQKKSKIVCEIRV